MNDQSACRSSDMQMFLRKRQKSVSLPEVTLGLHQLKSLGNFCVCLAELSRYLIELQHIQEVKELPVLLVVLQLDVVLLEAVKCQLGLVIHKNFHRLGQPVEAGGR